MPFRLNVQIPNGGSEDEDEDEEEEEQEEDRNPKAKGGRRRLKIGNWKMVIGYWPRAFR